MLEYRIVKYYEGKYRKKIIKLILLFLNCILKELFLKYNYLELVLFAMLFYKQNLFFRLATHKDDIY